MHQFVLSFLYGKDKLDTMLSEENIIEHLDNNGLNCTYDNLHVLSADYNKAKAFTIDKQSPDPIIPAFVTDVFYSHKKQHYQIQIVFNKDIYFFAESKTPVDSFYCVYTNFIDLYMDWLYVLDCRERKFFDIQKFHSTQIYAKQRPLLILTEKEQTNIIIERDGKLYLRLETDDPNRMAFINHTAFQEID